MYMYVCVCVYTYPYVWGLLFETKSVKIFFRDTALRCSVENVCSDEALSQENMAVSETEGLLEEREERLQPAQEPMNPDENDCLSATWKLPQVVCSRATTKRTVLWLMRQD